MTVAYSAIEAEQQLTASQDVIITSIGIPARPAILVSLQDEIAKEDSDFGKIGRLVSGDVALTVSVLRIVNSSAYALSRRCETADDAIRMLGLKTLNSIVTSLMLRNVVSGVGLQLNRFWDVTSKRTHAMKRLAQEMQGVDVDTAQSFGLFCDAGIPLLMRRFPDYRQTLAACNIETIRSFTEVEQSAHHTDHALVGAMMARSWGSAPLLCQAIRLHHDYAIFQDPKVPDVVARLIAMGLLAEIAIQCFAGQNTSAEWHKGGDQAAGVLLLSDQDVDDWVERLGGDFALGLG